MNEPDSEFEDTALSKAVNAALAKLEQDRLRAGKPNEQLCVRARTFLDALIERLPGTLRDEALRIGYNLSGRADSDDGRGNTLGTYHRSAQQITLYLHAIEEYCEEQHLDFHRGLGITYLHELGHHLGLPESELEKRSL